MSQNKKAVLALSGGLDSLAVLAFLKGIGYDVEGVCFTYDSKHNKYELEAAKKIADYYSTPLHFIDTQSIFSSFSSSLLKGQSDVPEGHYTDKAMESTVVPSRNIIFLSILSGYAWTVEADTIAIGVQGSEGTLYPDSTFVFIKRMERALLKGTGGKVKEIVAPFILHSKPEIIKWGINNNIPFDLSRTCFKDQEIACGKCGSCVKRLEGFRTNRIKDPIKYAV